MSARRARVETSGEGGYDRAATSSRGGYIIIGATRGSDRLAAMRADILIRRFAPSVFSSHLARETSSLPPSARHGDRAAIIFADRTSHPLAERG